MDTVKTLVDKISIHILGPLIFMMFGAATVVFLWGVSNFINGADKPDARSKGAQQMIWGILGILIMLGAVAIKNIVVGTATVL